jgi:hypothetical protein
VSEAGIVTVDELQRWFEANRTLIETGFAVDSVVTGSWEGEEKVRIAVVGQGTNR